MGGEIGVESDVGSGSCFWFEIPLSLAEPPRISRQPESGKTRQQFTGRRALVVEDDSANLEVLRAMLEQFGMDVICATNGENALFAFADQKFDLVLMDCQMPVMNGLQVIQRIREIEADTAAGRTRCWQ